ncbi:MAG: sarcosine oxidase subunit gamma family protein [Pseudomonadota bacterium]
MSHLTAEPLDQGLAPLSRHGGLSITVAKPAQILLLGAEGGPAMAKALGLDLPTPTAFSGQDPLLAWQGPGRWLLYAEAAAPSLPADLDDASLVTDGFFVLDLAGPRLRDLLSLGTSLESSPSALPAGASAITRFAELQASLMMLEEDHLRLLVERASRDYLWAWLDQAVAALKE